MAKFLTAGDILHRANGLVVVESIGEAPSERSYNLVVDEFATYFVGEQRLLVHDNTMRKPTQAIVPCLVR
jgi:hypothetical protein